MNFYTDYMSPLGRIILESDGASLTGVWLPRQRDGEPEGERAELPVFVATRRWLDVYFSGRGSRRDSSSCDERFSVSACGVGAFEAHSVRRHDDLRSFGERDCASTRTFPHVRPGGRWSGRQQSDSDSGSLSSGSRRERPSHRLRRRNRQEGPSPGL